MISVTLLRPLSEASQLISGKANGRAVLVVSIIDLYLDFVRQERLMSRLVNLES